MFYIFFARFYYSPIKEKRERYHFFFYIYISSYRQIFGKDSAPGDGYIRRIIDDGSSSDSDTDKPGGSGSSGTLKRKAVTDFLVDDDGEVRFKYLF